jgi:hypothetical protein
MTSTRAADKNPSRSVVSGAIVALAGLILSGPVGLALVALHPQPSWSGPEAFARAYHPIQGLPYFFGFLLVGGAVYLIAALQAFADRAVRARATAALGFAAAFAALIVFNYVVQTTFVPALAQPYAPENGPLIAALALSNPRSLGWAVEMWGYAVLGVATWLVAPVLAGHGRFGRIAAALFVANGPVSIVGGVWTALRPGWVMSPAGLTLFAAWNVLVAMMVALVIAAFHADGRQPGGIHARV